MSEVTFEQFSALAKEFRTRDDRINLVGVLGENRGLIDSKHGVVRVDDLEIDEAWWKVTNAVAYPAHKVSAFWQKDNENVRATGLSSQGRKKEYAFIVTDRNRIGEFDVIASVTGIYQSPLVYDLYLNLRESLNRTGRKVRPIDLFVTQNGGAQSLTLAVEDLTSIEGIPDAAEMRVVVETSVDGTTSHNMRTLVHNRDGDVDSTVYGNGFQHVSRHTIQNYIRGAMDFTPFLEKLVEVWNDTIIPTMVFMNEQKFSKEMALALIEKMAEESTFSDDATNRVLELYESDSLRTNATDNSLYRLNAAFSQYFSDELDEKRELQNRRRSDFQKSMIRELKRRKAKIK